MTKFLHILIICLLLSVALANKKKLKAAKRRDLPKRIQAMTTESNINIQLVRATRVEIGFSFIQGAYGFQVSAKEWIDGKFEQSVATDVQILSVQKRSAVLRNLIPGREYAIQVQATNKFRKPFGEIQERLVRTAQMCYTCNGVDANEECDKSRDIIECPADKDACLNVVRFDNDKMSLTKRCAQYDARLTKSVGNCGKTRKNSVCKCMCRSNMCNQQTLPCVDECMDELPMPLKSSMKCTNKNMVGSVCKWECDEGYMLKGLKETKCRSDRTWSVMSPPQCIIDRNPRPVTPKNCKPVPRDINANVKCTNTMKQGSVCKFRCKAGYTRSQGSNERSCRNSKWTGVPLVCKERIRKKTTTTMAVATNTTTSATTTPTTTVTTTTTTTTESPTTTTTTTTPVTTTTKRQRTTKQPQTRKPRQRGSGKRPRQGGPGGKTRGTRIPQKRRRTTTTPKPSTTTTTTPTTIPTTATPESTTTTTATTLKPTITTTPKPKTTRAKTTKRQRKTPKARTTRKPKKTPRTFTTTRLPRRRRTTTIKPIPTTTLTTTTEPTISTTTTKSTTTITTTTKKPTTTTSTTTKTTKPSQGTPKTERTPKRTKPQGVTTTRPKRSRKPKTTPNTISTTTTTTTKPTTTTTPTPKTTEAKIIKRQRKTSKVRTTRKPKKNPRTFTTTRRPRRRRTTTIKPTPTTHLTTTAVPTITTATTKSTTTTKKPTTTTSTTTTKRSQGTPKTKRTPKRTRPQSVTTTRPKRSRTPKTTPNTIPITTPTTTMATTTTTTTKTPNTEETTTTIKISTRLPRKTRTPRAPRSRKPRPRTTPVTYPITSTTLAPTTITSVSKRPRRTRTPQTRPTKSTAPPSTTKPYEITARLPLLGPVHDVAFVEEMLSPENPNPKPACKMSYVLYKNAYLKGVVDPNYISYLGGTLEDCEKRCCYEKDIKCKSFTYFKKVRMCFIMNVTEFDNMAKLKPIPGYQHALRIDDFRIAEKLANREP